MVRLASLSHGKVYLPTRQLERFGPRGAVNLPLTVGRNLENRLTTFALKNGARSAFLHVIAGTTVLVVRDKRGNEIKTAITGKAYEWHQALDKIDEADEDKRAGLLRYLKPSADLHTPLPAHDLADQERPRVKSWQPALYVDG